MKILLATDGSLAAQTALVSAARLLRRQDNIFHLLYIAPNFDAPALKAEEHTRKAAAKFERTVRETFTMLRCEGIAAELFTRTGSPSDVLTGMAEDYDVIVVGAQGQHQRRQPGLGHVAHDVVQRARGVVLIGREIAADKNFRILVGMNGSQAAQNALRALTGSFNLDGSELTLMHVIEMPWLHLRLGRRCCEEPGACVAEKGGDPLLNAQVECEVWREARRILSDACAELRGCSFLVQTLIEEGSPSWQLLSQTEVGEYDLLVVGATETCSVKHPLSGVSADLAWNAPCSVAVIR